MSEVQESVPLTEAGSRRTRAQLRELLIEAGLEVLAEEGLGSGAEHVTFKRVFERLADTAGIRVTNASVIGRVWQNQADFQSDVLATVADRELTAQTTRRDGVAEAILAASDRSTPQGRLDGLQQLSRAIADTYLAQVAESRPWATMIGVWALSADPPSSGDCTAIHDALRRSYQSIDATNLEFVRRVRDGLGLRLRPNRNLVTCSASLSALAKGCALRDRVQTSSLRGIVRPTGPNGTAQEWTILGIGIEAILLEYFELDPDWSPTA